ncbi:MAG: LysR family transcriptional regulator [Kofleriaceae bacterium]
MAMQRFRRISDLWNWLPGFRGVAEHENVHKAAEVMGITPSALSRTVKLLESAIGSPLFVRQGARLQMTPLGAELLTVTRNCMRQIDDCIAQADVRRQGGGPVHVGVTSDVAAAVVAQAVSSRTIEAARVHVLSVAEDAASQQLLQGNVDMIVSEPAVHISQLVCERLGEARFGIYAAHDHPSLRDSVAASELLEHGSFVALTSGSVASRTASKVACYCDSIDVARTICESSPLLCVFPDVWARRAPLLRRIADEGAPMLLHAVRRQPLPAAPAEPLLTELIERLRATLSA